MPTVVIPFAGAEGKTRLHSSRRIRRALAHAMFCDVLAACAAVGDTRVVTPDEEAADAARDAGAEVVADVPCVVPHDLRTLLAATPAGCVALVEALDGTTNALSLPSSEAFVPLY